MAYYLVHKEKIKENIDKLKNSFLEKGLDFELFYSVKTNFAKPVLKTIKNKGANFEIVSSYEWNLIKKFKPEFLVLNGPGKDLKFVEEIINKVKTLYFNIDNDTDFDILQFFDEKILKQKIKIGLRIYLSSEEVWNRFGWELGSNKAEEKIKQAGSLFQLNGFHFHFSTNNFKIKNYEIILKQLKNICQKLNLNLEYLDIGGGLPGANELIFYQDVYEKLPTLIRSLFGNTKIISEAGRNIVSDAMDIEANVISLKETGENHFDITIDINISHFPCFFEKKFWIEYLPVKKQKMNPTEITIFGNSCMQIDKIKDGIVVEQVPAIGDKVIIHNVGAYSFSQAANFISKIPRVISSEL